MMDNEFEAAFGTFLECRAYDTAQQAQFQLVRQAFLAGWLAAGGTPAQDQRIFTCTKGENAQKDCASTD